MIPVLTKAMDAGLVDVELLELLSRAYIQTGQTALALQALDQAARLASDNSEVLERIAGIRLGIAMPAGGGQPDPLARADARQGRPRRAVGDGGAGRRRRQ